MLLNIPARRAAQRRTELRYRGSLALCICALSLPMPAENWPQWRGPALNGISNEKNLPVRWSDHRERRLEAGACPAGPGRRRSSGATASSSTSPTATTTCICGASTRPRARCIWKKQLGGGNYQIRKQNMSSPSPVTDGKSVWVMTGTGILKGFDFDGQRAVDARHPEGLRQVRPELGIRFFAAAVRGPLYVQVLHGMKTDDPSYVLRIDKKTGKTLWRVERPTRRDPRIARFLHHAGAAASTANAIEIVVTGGDCVTGHDPATGKELWRGNGFNPTTTRTTASSRRRWCSTTWCTRPRACGR